MCSMFFCLVVNGTLKYVLQHTHTHTQRKQRKSRKCCGQIRYAICGSVLIMNFQSHVKLDRLRFILKYFRVSTSNERVLTRRETTTTNWTTNTTYLNWFGLEFIRDLSPLVGLVHFGICCCVWSASALLFNRFKTWFRRWEIFSYAYGMNLSMFL